MKRFPWKPVGMVSAIVTVLVVLRCFVTVGRVLYYGGNYWVTTLLDDPWFYIGMVAAALCTAAFVVLAIRERNGDGGY